MVASSTVLSTSSTSHNLPVTAGRVSQPMTVSSRGRGRGLVRAAISQNGRSNKVETEIRPPASAIQPPAACRPAPSSASSSSSVVPGVIDQKSELSSQPHSLITEASAVSASTSVDHVLPSSGTGGTNKPDSVCTENSATNLPDFMPVASTSLVNSTSSKSNHSSPTDSSPCNSFTNTTSTAAADPCNLFRKSVSVPAGVFSSSQPPLSFERSVSSSAEASNGTGGSSSCEDVSLAAQTAQECLGSRASTLGKPFVGPVSCLSV